MDPGLLLLLLKVFVSPKKRIEVYSRLQQKEKKTGFSIFEMFLIKKRNPIYEFWSLLWRSNMEFWLLFRFFWGTDQNLQINTKLKWKLEFGLQIVC